jgi:hypothetical protein
MEKKRKINRINKVLLLLFVGLFSCSICVLTDNAAAYDCGPVRVCNIDLNCEWFGGSTCLNAGGAQTCAPQCGDGGWRPDGTGQCGLRLTGSLGVCINPAGGCGGSKCTTDGCW